MNFNGGPLRPPPDNLTLPQFLLDIHHPDRPIRKGGNPWLVDDPSGKSYGCEDVRARVQGLANVLSFKYGIQENDTVCLFSPNHIDFGIVVWAVHRLGAVISTANPGLTVDELVHQFQITHPVIIITHTSVESTASEISQKAGISQERVLFLSDDQPTPPSMRSNAFVEDLIAEGNQRPLSFTERTLQPGGAKTKPAFLVFSSGTTGRPKAVAIAHYSVVSILIQLATFHRAADPTYDVPYDSKRFRPGDVAAAVVPLFHIYGLVVNLFFMVFCGMTVVVTPKFNFDGMLKSIERYKITHLFLIPPHMILFCKRPSVQEHDLSSVRYVATGAAPTSPELTLQFQKVMPNAEIGQGYGLTETCATLTMFPLSQRLGTPGSIGQLLPGTQAKVIKDDGTLGGYNEQGELVVKGPQVALGYVDNIEATKETFVDGWVHTGDEVIIKENGDIFIVDRRKEIFKVRGYQVAPSELEGHLLDHPDVGDAGVIGVPDEFSGEVPLAFVVLNSGAASRIAKNPQESAKIKEALVKHVADAKIKYKWLAGGVEFIDAIPMSPSGKILRRFLRERAKVIIEQRVSPGTLNHSSHKTAKL